MCASVEEYLLHASIGQELEGIFDEGGVCEWKKTLSIPKASVEHVHSRSTNRAPRLTQRTLGLSSVKGSNLVSKVSASTTACKVSSTSSAWFPFGLELPPFCLAPIAGRSWLASMN